MGLGKSILRATALALIILVLLTSTVLAAYSYYAAVQVQETSGNSYSYLPISVAVDNDYLSDNGYMSLTGLDTRVLSGSTELKHMVAGDRTLFVAPTVGANSTGNYRYTLGETTPLGSFPVIAGYNGYVTISEVFPTVAAVNGGNNTTDSTSHTVNLPSGIISGNLLLAFFASDGNPTITFPGGWTQLFQTANGTAVALGAWYRVADGTEESTISVTTSASEMTAHTTYRITDYTGTPECGTAATGSSTAPNPPSLSPSWGAKNTLWFAVSGNDDLDTVSAYPSNYSSGRNDYANNANGCGVGSARRAYFVASEDPGTFTLSASEEWVANTVAVYLSDAMELGNNFQIEQKGYVNTSAGSNKNLVYKEGAFRTYVSAGESISLEMSVAYGGDFPSIAASNTSTVSTAGTSHAVNLPSNISAGDLLIILFSTYSTEGTASITWPSGWTQLSQTSYSSRVFGAAYKVASGSEGSSVTVTTDLSAYSAHVAYRVATGTYSGVPECGTAATGSNANPDSPSLSPSWGSHKTLWIACFGALYTSTTASVSSYPANYTLNQLNPITSGTYHVEVGAAARQYEIASEDPGTYILVGSTSWIANTIAIAPPSGTLTVTATGVPSGELIIKSTADGTNLTLSVTNYTGTHQGNSPQSTALSGASVPDNSNNWILMQNNVMPYMEYYKHTVSGTLIAWYQPVSMIVGTNLDDREGTDAGETGTSEEDGTITWGSNPEGVSATIGSLISSTQPGISPAGDEEVQEIVPPSSIPAGGVVDTVALQDNPFYPIVKLTSDHSGLTEEQIWFGGATFIVFLGMAVSLWKIPHHLFIGGIVGLALSGLFVAMLIYPWWVMLITGFMFLATLLMERKPVI